MAKSVIRVVAAVIERNGRYLLTQRKAQAIFPLLWEFPGGRVEKGETEIDALMREVRGRIGVGVEVCAKLGEHLHEYDGYDVYMMMFSCSLPEGAEPEPLSVNEIRWVGSDEFEKYEFPPADQHSMSKLLGLAN